MVKRQLPKPAEFAELLRFKKPELSARKRRLDKALTIYDLRRIAKRRTPAAAFNYTDGGAEGELSMNRARHLPTICTETPSSRTSSSTRTSCGRPSTSTRPPPSSGTPAPCPSASPRPDSPA